MDKEKNSIIENKHFVIITIVVIGVLLVMAVVGGTVLYLKNIAKNEEESVEAKCLETIDAYFAAFNTLCDEDNSDSADEVIATMDLKGAYAWEECEGNVEEFLTTYEGITDDDVTSYENEYQSMLEMFKNLYGTYLAYYTMTRDQDAEVYTEEVSNVDGLVKVTTTIVSKWATSSEESGDNEISESSEICFYLYNYKLISLEEKEADDEETEKTVDDEENEVDENVDENIVEE